MNVFKTVNYIHHLRTFYRKVRNDGRLKANDVGLYVALFQIWNDHHFPQKFQIVRREVMQLCKIGSRTTYLNALKWLDKCGYIVYEPSGLLYGPCQISICPFNEDDGSKNTPVELSKGTDNEPAIGSQNGTTDRPDYDSDTGSEKGLNYNNKQINIKTGSKQGHAQKRIVINEKKEPLLKEVEQWFGDNGHSLKEARKFYFHYAAINWMLSGQPIANWQAAAAKWSENIKTQKNDKPGRLHTDNNKNYDKPF